MIRGAIEQRVPHMTQAAVRNTPSRPGEPVWEIVDLFPEQGSWTEEEYFALNTNRLVEFDNGMIEVLPVPTKTHQLIAAFLYKLLESFVSGKGRVFYNGYRLRIGPQHYREPDVLYLTAEQDARARENFAEAAELVMEVVSADDPARDYEKKRTDYAKAAVPEYWIIDASKRQVMVLRLAGGAYVEHGTFGPGETAASSHLAGFRVAVDDVLSQGH